MNSFLYLILFSFLSIIFTLLFYISRLTQKNHLYLEVSNGIEEELRKTIHSEIDKIARDTSKKLQIIVEKTTQSYEKEISDFSQQILKQSSMIEELRKMLEKEILEYTKKELELTFQDASKEMKERINSLYNSLSKELNEEMKGTQKEIENYKKKRLEEIDKNIYKIIEKVSKEVIGKSLDISTHEKLIISSLEKAKKENIL